VRPLVAYGRLKNIVFAHISRGYIIINYPGEPHVASAIWPCFLFVFKLM